MALGTILLTVIYLILIALVYVWFHYAGVDGSKLNTAEKDLLITSTKFGVNQNLNRRGIPDVFSSPPNESSGASTAPYTVPWWFPWLYTANIIFSIALFVPLILLPALYGRSIFMFLYTTLYDFTSDSIYLIPSSGIGLAIFFAMLGLASLICLVIFLIIRKFSRTPSGLLFDAWSGLVMGKSHSRAPAMRWKHLRRAFTLEELQNELRRQGPNYGHKTLVFLSLIFLLISFPFTVLAFDTYTVLSDDGIHYNRFLSLRERVYSWNEVSKIQFGFRSLENNDPPEVVFFLEISHDDGTIVHLEDENEIDVVTEDINNILVITEKENIPTEYREPTSRQRKLMDSHQRDIDKVLMSSQKPL
ncbi:MAG: hypothetical protein AAB420_00040 [Patescibacteria group bacterium]